MQRRDRRQGRDDTIYGGDGNDIVNGGTGNGFLFGDEDSYVNGGGIDHLDGGPGRDEGYEYDDTPWTSVERGRY